ncbi:MAG: Gldg family protein [bacterium]|nr:Gldg family protein [bacterium]
MGYSHGRLSYEFLDPGSTEELEKEASSFRIPPVQINIIQNDKFELKKVYMGLAFFYEDRQEVIPLVQNTIGLEYDITSTIKRLTSKEIKKVAFLTGHEEPDIYKDIRTAQETLAKTYQVQTLDLSDKLVPDGIEVLIILNPKKVLSDWEKLAIDQFLVKGGKLAFLLNRVDTEIETSKAELLDLKLDDWLTQYGFNINSDLLFDARNTRINIQQRRGWFTITNTIPYPFFPEIHDLEKSHVAVKDLENLTFYFPSSLDLSSAEKHNLTTTVLARSSKKSGLQSGRFDINPLWRMPVQDFNKESIPLAAIIMGNFKSYFTNRDLPDTKPVAVKIVKEGKEGRLVVVGDGNFIQDKYLGNKNNLAFFLNLVDWLAQDEDLITIRSREVTSRSLKEITPGIKKLVKYSSLFGPPGLVIICGLLYWQVRRLRRKAREI